MNAIRFIKEHGVEKAREVVEGAPDGATHLSDDACHYVNADFKPLPAHIKEQLPKLIVIDDLKRLVESVGMVKDHGGLETIRKCVEKTIFPLSDRIIRMKKAIADYEVIYES